MKAAIKREESQARLNYPEREQARPKVNDEGVSLRNRNRTNLSKSYKTFLLFKQRIIRIIRIYA